MDEATDNKRQLSQLAARNQKLVELLQKSRAELEQLFAEVNALAEPASTYGVFLAYSPHQSEVGTTAEVYTNGRVMQLKVSPNVEPGSLQVGQQVRLGDGFVVVEGCAPTRTGELATVVERLDQRRAVVANSAGDNRVVLLAQALQESVRAGEVVLLDTKASVAVEKVDQAEVSQLSLEEVPDVRYEDIGGLDEQISQIRDSVELPFIHPELYREYGLQPPKGVLLYGPPGCGKTLIAKAVANSLSTQMGGDGSSYFLNVKGPELLNKYVGETERRIRLIFERARELAQASADRPVVIFFDEMESIFRTRGSGVSSDMETTVVPQLLTELDGVEGLSNVVIIGATNREELIDPAIMRPGRLDMKVRINRPTKRGAREIFARHFDPSIPHVGDIDELIGDAVDELYSDRPFAQLHFSNGQRQVLHYRDFVSGAMIANILARAKKLAIKEALSHHGAQRAAEEGTGGVEGGIGKQHLRAAIAAEQEESEYMPTSTNPEEWSKIVSADHGGSRVTSVELLSGRSCTWPVC